ncbi:DMT family transporter [Rhizobium tumorigenes]|uniref:DMT family transporter n=1 Tax=Rhizobium tumorigenes TaxID=2041385 RepID=UPI00242011AD|nr:DMT family transporter [Rhizobium tumorigenes]WFR99895.1 DMT family transporter [Rhizobium tumorigenes]
MADGKSIATATPLTPASAFAPFATVLIWSGNVIVTEAAFGVIAPGSIAFYRWLIAFLVLLPFVAKAAWQQRAVAARHWLQLAVLGALGMVVYQSLAYEAAKTTTAVNMGVMLALMPLMSALLASLLAAERLSFNRLAGGAVSLAGLVYLTSHGHPATLMTGGFHIGDGLMLIAIAANSLYGVLLKRWTIPLSLWLQLFWQIAFATLMLVPVWLMGTISPITTANLPLILYAAIPTSLIAPLYWMTAIRRLGAARTALFINLLPVVVAILAWAILKEELHAYHAIGGVLALAGVGIGLRQSKPSRVTAKAATDPVQHRS